METTIVFLMEIFNPKLIMLRQNFLGLILFYLHNQQCLDLILQFIFIFIFQIFCLYFTMINYFYILPYLFFSCITVVNSNRFLEQHDS